MISVSPHGGRSDLVRDFAQNIIVSSGMGTEYDA